MKKGKRLRQGPYVASVIIAVLTGLGCYMGSGENQEHRHDARALHNFNERVEAYVRVHHKAEDTFHLPHLKPTGSIRKIQQRQRAMARHIGELRRNAREGDIFTPEVKAYFERALAAAYGANSEGILANLVCISEEDRKLQPNDVYPATWEYNPMPPTILLHLPRLPEEVEYRIVNKDLILLDVEADMVVDILRNSIALPAGRGSCDD
ncbi:MAG: hypothetical protein LAO76_12255 [Acidobacteriia bacterium]|nr:hypothetical protein [Terriglobia bacterium]